MSEIKLIRELYLYKKMYHHIFNLNTDAIKVCKDPVVKDMLIKAQQETAKIYMNEEIEEFKGLTTEEITIMFLLFYIQNIEASKPVDIMDVDAINQSVDWLLNLQHQK